MGDEQRRAFAEFMGSTASAGQVFYSNPYPVSAKHAASKPIPIFASSICMRITDSFSTLLQNRIHPANSSRAVNYLQRQHRRLYSRGHLSLTPSLICLCLQSRPVVLGTSTYRELIHRRYSLLSVTTLSAGSTPTLILHRRARQQLPGILWPALLNLGIEQNEPASTVMSMIMYHKMR
jgi:hypothetical protein